MPRQTKIPYSTRGENVSVYQVTGLNFATANDGDYFVKSGDQMQPTSASGGAGGSIIGTDDAVLFKQGTNANTFAGGISKNGGLPNYAVVLDSTNYRVGIGGSSNALNPVNTLEVLGGQRIKNPAGADELVLDANTIGLIAGTNTLKLYSHNNNSDIANTQVDGGNNMLWVGGTVRPRDPVAFDLPNSSNNEALFKLKLEQGYNLDNPPNPPFDVQEPLSNLNGNFPIGNIVDWCSTQPLRMPKIIGRIASGVEIVPGNNYVISNFGTRAAFTDRMLYDPCSMRSRLAGAGWIYAGAPKAYRSVNVPCLVKFSFFIEGTFSIIDPLNKVMVYIQHYRNGVFLRTYAVGTSPTSTEAIFSGHRTIMGFANYNEDVDTTTDDFSVDFINQSPFPGGSNFTLNVGKCDFEFVPCP